MRLPDAHNDDEKRHDEITNSDQPTLARNDFERGMTPGVVPSNAWAAESWNCELDYSAQLIDNRIISGPASL